MIQSLKKDTIAYQLHTRPAFVSLNMSDVPLPQVVDAMMAFRGQSDAYQTIPGATNNEPVEGKPEVDALIFYMLNHAVSLVRQRVHPLQPLGKYLPLFDLYATEMAVRTQRMFFYLLLICTRESRHDKAKDQNRDSWGYSEKIIKFHRSLGGMGSDGAASALCKNPPSVTLGEYTRYLSDTFYKGNYNGGFGGKAWGQVADVLRDYVSGKLTAEMMMDTSFTLCHNNGPIFNKGMLFSGYSHDIYHILDVQRSGQIPQLIAEKVLAHTKVHLVQLIWSRCHKLLGAEFDGYVDYFKVEELGALKKYDAQKNKQVQEHGHPSKPSLVKKNGQDAFGILHPEVKVLDDAVLIEIYPGDKLEKVKVKR